MAKVDRKGKGKHTQSVVFNKNAGWTEDKSKKWCKAHGYHTDGHDENESQHRWRQVDLDADKFRSVNVVIDKMNDGKYSIMLVRGLPKGMSAKAEEADRNGILSLIRTGIYRYGLQNRPKMEGARTKKIKSSSPKSPEIKDKLDKKKETNMSLTATVKKVEEENRVLTAKVVDFEAKMKAADAENAASKKKITDMETAHAEQLAEMKTEKDEKDKRVLETHEQSVEKIETLETQVEDLTAKNKDLTGELAKAKGVLANPALADAGNAGQADGVEDGAAAADLTIQPQAKNIYEQYMDLKDKPAEQTAFWNKNEDAIRAFMKENFDKQPEAAKVSPGE